MDQLIIGITHAGSLAAEALLNALQQIEIEKESIRLYSSDDNVGNRLAYGSSYLVTLDQKEDSFEQCSLVMQLEPDDALSEKISSDGALLLKQGGNLYFSANEEESEGQIDYSQSVFNLVDSEAYLILKTLQSIHQSNPIESAQITVLLPASHDGKKGVDELASQTVELLNARPVEPKVFPEQLAFNLYAKNNSAKALNLSQQVKFNLGEETKFIQLQLIQTPVFYGSTFIVTVQCEFPLDERQLGTRFSELTLVEFIKENDTLVSPVTSLQEDAIAIISQLMVSEQDNQNVQFVLTADHLRHGAAELFLNAMLVIRKTFL